MRKDSISARPGVVGMAIRFASPCLRVFAVTVVMLVCIPHVFAHQQSDSYLGIHVDDGGVSGRWDVALHDLDRVLHLDTNNDGQVTWEEIRLQRERIGKYILGRLKVTVDGVPGVLRQEQLEFDEHIDGVYAVLRFAVDGVKPSNRLEVEYQLFFDYDPFHRGLFRLDRGGRIQTAVFSPMQPAQHFDISRPRPWHQFLAFANEGVWHIWKGFDHILFLLALLLPSVLRREKDGWRVVDQFRPAFINVFKIVTAFTAAHSITLTLATLGLVRLPSRLVESTIAASVVLAAVNNLRPIFHGRGWLVAFGFGLVHGFGFASALMEMGLSEGSLALTLVGFNVGVEVGQLAIVAVFLPLAYTLRRSWFYQRVTLQAGSTCVVMIAATWMVERIFDFRVLPF
jgi:hypothetical protein